ncbi:hypothetical protein [Enterococcus rivorum]|uniref:hypothetical protein n=1 Tax=Enterococcus rivorum TaxID=762845 RepID=UPI00363730D2
MNQIKEDLAFSSIDLGINGKDKLYGYGLPRVKNMYTKVPDKISPTGKFKEQVIEVNEPRTEIDFVTEIQDNSDSEVIVSYLERPKFSELGKQEVKIQLKDNSGNQTILVGTIVIEDTKAPTGIYKNIKVIKGEDIKPEMFVDQVTDNHDSKKVKITFENSVDTNQVGEKEIEIRLSDFSGNFIILKGKLEVLELIETKPNINLAKRESIASSKKISDEKASNNDGDSDKDKNLNSRKSFPNTSEKKVRFSIIGYLLLGVSLCIVSSRYGSEQ